MLAQISGRYLKTEPAQGLYGAEILVGGSVRIPVKDFYRKNA